MNVYRKQDSGDKKEVWTGRVITACIIFVLLLLAVLAFAIVFSKNQQTVYPVEKQTGKPYKSEIKHIDNRKIVVIDAGHGGYDPGALDAKEEISEAEINQQVADELAKMLETRDETVKVVITREPGEFSQPMERATVAKTSNADLFLSLHLNSDELPDVRGFQCFPVPPGRVYHQESYRFAQIITEKVKATSLPVRGTNGIYYTFYVPNGAGGFYKDIFDDGWFDKAIPRREETYGVLEYSGCPSVLIEQWYISNALDMELMNSSEGIQVMAECIYSAVYDYFRQ